MPSYIFLKTLLKDYFGGTMQKFTQIFLKKNCLAPLSVLPDATGNISLRTIQLFSSTDVSSLQTNFHPLLSFFMSCVAISTKSLPILQHNTNWSWIKA